MGEPIDTGEIRAYPGCPACWDRIVALCDELDATRAALEAARQLHANLLAHLRMEDGR